MHRRAHCHPRAASRDGPFGRREAASACWGGILACRGASRARRGVPAAIRRAPIVPGHAARVVWREAAVVREEATLPGHSSAGLREACKRSLEACIGLQEEYKGI